MIRAFILLICTSVAGLHGCSSQPQGSVDPFGAAPSDFYVDVTILENPGKAMGDESAAASSDAPTLRPSRYVLFSDGTLRYGPDPAGTRGVAWLPPIARVLTRPQTGQVWSLAQQLGLANPDAADPITNFKLVSADFGERMVLMDFSGNGRRWNFIRRAPIDQPSDPALTKFVQRLAELAWVDEQAESTLMLAPRRYDFGPDPYARYRTPE